MLYKETLSNDDNTRQIAILLLLLQARDRAKEIR